MTHLAASLITALLLVHGEGTTSLPSEARHSTSLGYSSGGVDTTLPVRSGTRLEVENFAGEIEVRAWGKDALRIEASHSRRTRVELDRSPSVIRIVAHGRMGPANVGYRLTVPNWMAMQLTGLSTDILVNGTKASVKARSINGDIEIEGGDDIIEASSVQGRVKVSKARGRVEVSSVNQGVRVSRVTGDLTVESLNGAVVLDQIDSRSVNASSINGNIVYSGAFKSGGVYSFSTHNGGVVIGLPEDPDVTVSVATYNGGFSSTIPVRLAEGRKGKRFSFTLGSGSAKLELESFQGSIRLVNFDQIQERVSVAERQLEDEGREDPDDDDDE